MPGCGAKRGAPAAAVAAEPLPVATAVQNRIEEGGLYSVTALSGVTLGASPAWLQQRLERAGLRAGNQRAYIGNTPIMLGGDLIVAIDGEAIQDTSDIGLRSEGKPGEDYPYRIATKPVVIAKPGQAIDES